MHLSCTPVLSFAFAAQPPLYRIVPAVSRRGTPAHHTRFAIANHKNPIYDQTREISSSDSWGCHDICNQLTQKWVPLKSPRVIYASKHDVDWFRTKVQFAVFRLRFLFCIHWENWRFYTVITRKHEYWAKAALSPPWLIDSSEAITLSIFPSK